MSDQNAKNEAAFPDKQTMIRWANVLWVLLIVAPIIFLLVAFFALSGSSGLGGADPGLVQVLFFVLLIVSASNLGVTAFTQTSKRFQPSLASRDPLSPAFLTLAIGSVLSEPHAVYGLILTLLSGSLIYILAFSTLSWAALIWVRTRFTRNLERLPD